MVRGRERAAETGRGFFADLVDQGMRKYLLLRLFGAGRVFYVARLLALPILHLSILSHLYVPLFRFRHLPLP